MKVYVATLALAVSAPTTSVACDTAAFASCGSDSGTTCCPDGYYCQPWDASFYQCVQPPSQCPQQLTNIDLYGNDIKTLYSIQPSDCCAQCAETAGCVAYTFVNSNPGTPACYLKSAAGEPRASTGAVSGILASSSSSTTEPAATTATPVSNETEPTPPPSPANNCLVGANEQCGSSEGTTCCPDGYYCQPWSADYYQCITPPVAVLAPGDGRRLHWQRHQDGVCDAAISVLRRVCDHRRMHGVHVRQQQPGPACVLPEKRQQRIPAFGWCRVGQTQLDQPK